MSSDERDMEDSTTIIEKLDQNHCEQIVSPTRSGSGSESPEYETNFVEILVDEEYIEEEFSYDEEIEEKQVKSEPQDVEEILDNTKNETYHCSSCDVHFDSVTDHINQFHENQSVLVDGVESNIETEELHVKIEPNDEEIVEEFNMEEAEEELEDVAYELVEIDDQEDKTYETISEENCYDVHGRPYVRKKIREVSTGIVNSTVHKCDTCAIHFYSMHDFDNHKCGDYIESTTKISPVKHLDNSKKSYDCPECQYKCINSRSLSSHMRVHRNNAKKIKNIKTNIEERSTLCTECNTTFPTIKSLKLHVRMHDPIKIRPMEDAIRYELKSTSMENGPEKEMFFCDICNKSYDKVYEEIHKNVHETKPSHLCTVCNKKFSSSLNLMMHLKAHQDHSKPKGMTKAESKGITLPYECSYCGRQFARPHEKVKHERIHTGEKPYKCEICGKCFRVSYCLTLHLRTHTGARPYVCPHCNKRFKAYSVYNHHLNTHSDERPYKCPYCPKAFKTSVQLGGHKNSHTKPFNCPECNRPFASLYAVKAHMETHKKSSQNLKHRCEICGAIYARVFALRDHMKEQHEQKYTDEAETEITEILLSEIQTTNDNEETPTEITIDDIQFQTEEVVTEWLTQ